MLSLLERIMFTYSSNLSLMQVKTDMDFEIVSKEECSVTGDREEMYSKLEQDLIGQVG